MQLVSSVPPVLMPDARQETVLQLGLAPLAMHDWIQSDADFIQFHEHKLAVQSLFPAKVSGARSTEAVKIFAEFLLETLLVEHSEIYYSDDSTLTHLPSGLSWALADRSLAAVSRWVQEDICLLEPEQGVYKLTAASVCSPSNWRLEEKIGCSLDAIHSPVPNYDKVLATRVNRLLTNLKPEKSLCRFNWSVQRGNELLWRDDLSSQAETALYWRIERQSLLRIPTTDIIIFSIRIYLHSFADLVKMPDFRSNLQTIIGKLPAEQSAYKGLLDKLF